MVEAIPTAKTKQINDIMIQSKTVQLIHCHVSVD